MKIMGTTKKTQWVFNKNGPKIGFLFFKQVLDFMFTYLLFDFGIKHPKDSSRKNYDMQEFRSD